MTPELRGPTADVPSTLPPNDYVSPGFAVVMPDAAFPNMVVGDTSVPRWPWLRRWVEQNWYTDRRNPDTGFASRDEAAILHNNALLFRGKPCLEVGCWRGWSAVHIALGSGGLHIIDPVFGDPDFAESIRASCEAAGVLDHVTFHQGFSPGAIDALSQSMGARWSFIFIDADHEGDAPRLDAEAAMRHAASTAMVMFHDLASPHVAAGLDAMRNAGWRTMVYQTTQIMGVAWRGTIEPVAHSPDPKVFWTLPRHLSGYDVSGWHRPLLNPDGAWWPNMTMEDRRNAAMMRAQAAEDDRVASLAEGERQTTIVRAERDAAVALAARLEPIQADLEHETAVLKTQLEDTRAESAQILAGLRQAEHQVASLQVVRDAALGRSAVAEFEREQAIQRAQAAENSVAELAAACRRQETYLRNFRSLEDRALTFGATQERENAAMLELARWVVQKRVLIGLLRRPAGERIATLQAQTVALGLDGLVTSSVASWLCRRRMLLGLLRRPQSFGESFVGCALLQAAQAWRGNVLAEMALRLEGSGR